MKKLIDSYSINALSDKLGFDRRSLKRWLSGVKPVTTKRGKPCYNLDDALLAIKEHQGKRSATTEPKNRQLQLQNEKLEYQIAILKGEYVPVANVEKWGAQLGSQIRKAVTRIHDLAPSLVGQTVAEAQTCLREKEAEILQCLHNLDEEIRRAIEEAKLNAAVAPDDNEPDV